MYPKRLALPVFLMILIALMWAIISFLLGVADAGAQSYPPPYNARVVAMVVSLEDPPSLYALTNAPRGHRMAHAVRPYGQTTQRVILYTHSVLSPAWHSG